MDIRIHDLVRTYYSEGKQIRALDHVDLTIPGNRIFTLLGPSGCGKTTLLRCIVGLEAPMAARSISVTSWSGQKKRTSTSHRNGGPRHGLSDLRHLAAHERFRQRRLPAADPEAFQGGNPSQGGSSPGFRPTERFREAPGNQAEWRSAAARSAGPRPGRGTQGHPL